MNKLTKVVEICDRKIVEKIGYHWCGYIAYHSDLPHSSLGRNCGRFSNIAANRIVEN